MHNWIRTDLWAGRHLRRSGGVYYLVQFLHSRGYAVQDVNGFIVSGDNPLNDLEICEYLCNGGYEPNA